MFPHKVHHVSRISIRYLYVKNGHCGLRKEIWVAEARVSIKSRSRQTQHFTQHHAKFVALNMLRLFDHRAAACCDMLRSLLAEVSHDKAKIGGRREISTGPRRVV